MTAKRRLDPRVVACLYVAIFLVVMMVYDVVWDALLAVVPLALVLVVNRVPLRQFLRPVSGTLVALAALLFLLNLWYYPRVGPLYHPEYAWWLVPGRFQVSLDGITFSLQATTRFLVILLIMVSLSLLVPVADLVDIMYRVRMPKQLILALGIGLSYVPVLTRELLTIREAQEARAWKVRTANPLKKAKSWAPLLVPAVKAAMRHAGLLAVAIECRGFSPEAKRVSRKKLRLAAVDYVFLCLIGAAVISAALLGNWGLKVASWKFTSDLVAALLIALGLGG